MIKTGNPVISIYTEMTPNPETMKFVANKLLYPGKSIDFPDVETARPSPLAIANEKFLTAYGWGDSQWDGLSFANYGCWARTLYPGQSCTSTIAFTPSFVGTQNESYMLETGRGNRYGGFTATGLRGYRVVLPPSSGLLAR